MPVVCRKRAFIALGVPAERGGSPMAWVMSPPVPCKALNAMGSRPKAVPFSVEE